MGSQHSRREWGVTKIPQFTGKKALVLPGAFYGSAVALMAEAGFDRADTVEEADVVVFIGGVDVNPKLYNQTKIDETQSPSDARDNTEIEVYNECIRLKKYMFGICRGAQFLHVMNGGELWQHVTGHNGGDHIIYDIEEDVHVLATSYHHQMLMINKELELVAVCEDQISTVFKNSDMYIDLSKEGANASEEVEIEAGAYTATRCFFVQGHPEVGSPEYRSWSMTKLKEFCETYASWHVKDSGPSGGEMYQQWLQERAG